MVHRERRSKFIFLLNTIEYRWRIAELIRRLRPSPLEKKYRNYSTPKIALYTMVLPDNLRGRGKDKGWGEVQVRARVRGRFTVEVLQSITD